MEENTNIETINKKSLFKVSAYCGMFMCIYFAFRILGEMTFFNKFLSDLFNLDKLNADNKFIVSNIISVVLAYFIPITVTLLIFKPQKKWFSSIYKKPPKLSKAISNFPAVYGLGMAVNIISVLIIFLIRSILGKDMDVAEEIVNTTGQKSPSTLVAAVGIFVLYVLIAPIFEEFWLRGVVYDAVAPYGAPFAIFSTGILFGIMHGSIDRFFYTFAIGIALGYIRYATDSILATTILHAIFNSVAATLLILMTAARGDFQLDYFEGDDITAEGNIAQDNLHNFIVVLFCLFVVVVCLLIIIGIVSFLKKIRLIKNYRFPESGLEKSMTEKEKWGNFLFNPFMIMLYLILIFAGFILPIFL